MRVAIVYDCLYPHTVGGAERWYRNVAARLAAAGHEVTYLTRLQWEPGEEPDAPAGTRVIAVSGGRELYTASGRRKISVPLRFGWGLFLHMLRHRRDYDVVHTCAFPYFSLIAIRAASVGGGPQMLVDWFEVWSDDYWREYLGGWRGRIGAFVQRVCARLTSRAFTFSRLHARRLAELGLTDAIALPGLYEGPSSPDLNGAGPRGRAALFAGRMIKEKGVELIPEALALVRREDPTITAMLLGDGPERERVLAHAEALGVADAIDAPGFVASDRVDQEMTRAMCLLLPSRREGYGAVVIEAASHGTPSIVVPAADNAAVELIENGVNGVVCDSAEPAAIAAAILRVAADPERFSNSTTRWFAAHADDVSVEASVERILAEYGSPSPTTTAVAD